MNKTMNGEQTRTRWQSLVSDLCRNIDEWSAERNWTVIEETKVLTEERLGTYQVDARMIAYPGGRIHLEPVAADILGGEGRVDLLSYPNLNSLLLIRQGNDWKLFTDSRVPWPEPWGKECFFHVVNALTQ